MLSVAEKKKMAYLISYTLIKDEELFLYQRMNKEDTFFLGIDMYELLNNPAVFSPYLESKEPEVLIYRILHNMCKAIERVFDERIQSYFATYRGMALLLEVFPTYYQKGIEEKTLTQAFFVELFFSIDKALLGKAVRFYWRKHAKTKKILLNW